MNSTQFDTAGRSHERTNSFGSDEISFMSGGDDFRASGDAKATAANDREVIDLLDETMQFVQEPPKLDASYQPAPVSPQQTASRDPSMRGAPLDVYDERQNKVRNMKRTIVDWTRAGIVFGVYLWATTLVEWLREPFFEAKLLGVIALCYLATVPIESSRNKESLFLDIIFSRKTFWLIVYIAVWVSFLLGVSALVTAVFAFFGPSIMEQQHHEQQQQMAASAAAHSSIVLGSGGAMKNKQDLDTSTSSEPRQLRSRNKLEFESFTLDIKPNMDFEKELSDFRRRKKEAMRLAAKAEKDAARAVEKATRDAERAAREAAKAAEKAARDAAKEAEEAKKSAEKAARDAAREAEEAKKSAEKAARDAAREAEEAKKAAARDAEKAARDAAREKEKAAKMKVNQEDSTGSSPIFTSLSVGGGQPDEPVVSPPIFGVAKPTAPADDVKTFKMRVGGGTVSSRDRSASNPVPSAATTETLSVPSSADMEETTTGAPLLSSLSGTTTSESKLSTGAPLMASLSGSSYTSQEEQAVVYKGERTHVLNYEGYWGSPKTLRKSLREKVRVGRAPKGNLRRPGGKGRNLFQTIAHHLATFFFGAKGGINPNQEMLDRVAASWYSPMWR